ncbi:hypothetical protein H6P81_007224 [Aristolochia fimbriata]|uniref:Uncharacterized protein n=1 Tax=Aristolochia fimbriata TaxID=158543 RepID=A0AAV7EZK3_ARIFI|nr:hypothetical protein H6P81_007224 [Aristolochia fimbriata]
MGGGAAARSIGKFTSFNAVRSIQSHWHQLSDQAAFGRQGARPAVGIASAAVAEVQGVSAAVGSAHVDNDVSVVRTPVWEFDDWEFADDEGSELLASVDPIPRLVCGPAPTFEEAKDAVSDLKDALEQICVPSTGGNGALGIQESARQSLANSMSKSFVTSQSDAISSPAPKHVMKAFSVLTQSSEAQNVVAALAADKNVWDAVMKNEKVLEFCGAHHASIFPKEKDVGLNESVAENYVHKNHGSDSQAGESGFAVFVKSIKVRVAQMVSSISEYLHDIIGTEEDTTSSAERKRNVSDDMGKTVGASFLALAIVAIMVILCKRN